MLNGANASNCNEIKVQHDRELCDQDKQVSRESRDRATHLECNGRRDCGVQALSKKGLHFHDTSNEASNFEFMQVNTVQENFEGHTKHSIFNKAKEA